MRVLYVQVPLAGVLLSLLCLPGCSSGPSATSISPELLSPAVLIDRLAEQEGRVRTMTGKGTVSFEAPEVSGSAFFTVSLRKPDSLLVQLQGPFGLDAGFLFLAPDTFLVYSSLENRIYQGNPSSPRLQAMLPVALTPQQMLGAFTGSFLPDATACPDGPAVAEDDLLVLRCSGDDGRSVYGIDPVSMLVTLFLKYDGAGTLLVDARSSALLEQDGVYAPRKISVVLPASRSAVTVSYSSIRLNDPAPSFTFRLPGSASRRNGGGL